MGQVCVDRVIYFVAYDPDARRGKRWGVYRRGLGRASRRFAYQYEATEWAKDKAWENYFSQVVVQGRDGTIRYEHTYGRDPRPPPEARRG